MVSKTFVYSVKKSYSTQILPKLLTLMNQCMGGGYTVKEPEQEDHGLTQKRIGTSMHKCSRIKIYLFKSTSKSHVNCEG